MKNHIAIMSKFDMIVLGRNWEFFRVRLRQRGRAETKIDKEVILLLPGN